MKADKFIDVMRKLIREEVRNVIREELRLFENTQSNQKMAEPTDYPNFDYVKRDLAAAFSTPKSAKSAADQQPAVGGNLNSILLETAKSMKTDPFSKSFYEGL